MKLQACATVAPLFKQVGFQMKPCLGKPASPNKFDCSIYSQASDRNTTLALHAQFKKQTTQIQYLPVESSSTTVASCKQVAFGADSCPQLFCICKPARKSSKPAVQSCLTPAESINQKSALRPPMVIAK